VSIQEGTAKCTAGNNQPRSDPLKTHKPSERREQANNYTFQMLLLLSSIGFSGPGRQELLTGEMHTAAFPLACGRHLDDLKFI
jgi:hypothetical protein